MNTLETIHRINRPKLTQANYERENQTGETVAPALEETIIGTPDAMRVQLPRLHGWLHADDSSQQEEAIHLDGERLHGGGDSLRPMPRPSRSTDEPRSDAPGGDDRYQVKGRAMSIDRVLTAIFLQVCCNFCDDDLRRHYDEAFSWLTKHSNQ